MYDNGNNRISIAKYQNLANELDFFSNFAKHSIGGMWCQ